MRLGPMHMLPGIMTLNRIRSRLHPTYPFARIAAAPMFASPASREISALNIEWFVDNEFGAALRLDRNTPVIGSIYKYGPFRGTVVQQPYVVIFAAVVGNSAASMVYLEESFGTEYQLSHQQ